MRIKNLPIGDSAKNKTQKIDQWDFSNSRKIPLSIISFVGECRSSTSRYYKTLCFILRSAGAQCSTSYFTETVFFRMPLVNVWDGILVLVISILPNFKLSHFLLSLFSHKSVFNPLTFR